MCLAKTLFAFFRFSVEFLYTYLVHHHLPEKLDCVSTAGFPVTRESSYPLRHQLYNWMLPIDNGSDGNSDVLAFWAAKSSSRYEDIWLITISSSKVQIQSTFNCVEVFVHQNRNI